MCVCMCVCVSVCPCSRLLITTVVMWCDIDPIHMVNKFYSCFMATVVLIINGHGLALVHVVDTNQLSVN